MNDLKEKCHNCLYWEFKSGYDGICHRFPPSPSIRQTDKKTLIVLPLTKKDDWCGEFKNAK